MKKNIIILLIIALLVGISIAEELLVKNTTTELTQYTTKLEKVMNENDDNLNTKTVIEHFTELNNFWNGRKNKICIFANYDKIRYMDESMIKLNDAIKDNDNALAKENLSAVRSFKELIQYVMGFNINNLF